MVNALVVRKANLPKSLKSCRAAQYVRMSTDYQRYSIENQAAVIAAYAQMHNLSIVHTYRDEGESGLKIKNRLGLIQLLDDVRSGQADFDHIVVYDVSRWGRFQDVDESAHYEFVCKQAGIRVAYCAEQFDNDGSMLSSIVKNIKRVMAAEYSRELSTKVYAGQCRFARLGFKLGGRVGYALRREVVDEKLQSRGVLKDGDRKYITTDHIRVRPGTPEEVAVVRWIFQRFLQVKSELAVARELNRKAVPTNTAEPWTRASVGRLLRNENYLGNLIFNRRSYKLRETHTYNPPELWIRAEGCIDPIVDRDVFLRVQKIIKERRVDLTEGEMLARLRRPLMKERHLSPAIIDRTIGLPCTATYLHHFGSLRNVYRLIGYTSKRNCDYIDARQTWNELITKFALQVSVEIKNAGGRATFDSSTNCFCVEGATNISFRIARWCSGKKKHHSPYWTIFRQGHLQVGWLAVIRLAEGNKTVHDFVVIPTTQMVGPVMKVSERTRVHRGFERFVHFDSLVRTITRLSWICKATCLSAR
jgi:DNA invertase Pin-like site-specific DNA recombinase